MSVYLSEVRYWVREWSTSGETITYPVAKAVASYWQSGAETGAMAQFALDGTVEETLLEDVDSTIRYARSAGLGLFEETLDELDALKDWVMKCAAEHPEWFSRTE
jgi:hypothetical protein